MKFFLPCAVLVSLVSFTKGENLLSESMKKGIVKMGESCMKSVGATLEEVEALRNAPPYTGKAACVLACILEKAGVMNNKKYSKKGFMLAVTPFVLTDPKKLNRMKEISNICDKEITETSEDECGQASHVVVCLRANIPQLTDIKF